MSFKYAYIVPVIQGVLYPVTFAITYALSALVNKDVPAIFPYVSDTGVWSIERCIFSFMLGIGALLMFATLYIRIRQVKEILEKYKDTNFKQVLPNLNRATLYMGLVSVVGLFVLGCFQVHPFFVMHMLGAGTAFLGGWMTLAIQTYISFKIYPTFGNRGLNIFRAVLIVILGVALNLTGIFGFLSLIFFKGDDITQWTENSGGYQFHLISVASEWILVMGTVLYFSLYAIEFKYVIFYKPNIELIDT